MAKKCFVICPIGEAESTIRDRSDKVLRHIIKPIVEHLGYEALRSDNISAPGVITSQIIQHLLEDDLVIADLTDGNPNVYYELAIRHACKKAAVQMIHAGQRLPFDVNPQRTISFDYQDLDSVEKCKEQLRAQIGAVEKNPRQVDSPISQAIDILALSKSEKPVEQSLAQIQRMLERITAEICDSGPPVNPAYTIRSPIPFPVGESPVFIQPASATKSSRE